MLHASRALAPADIEENARNDNHMDLWLHMIRMMNEHDLSDKSILDFGCGQGGFLKALHKLHPYKSAVGTDIAEASLEIANGNLDGEPIDYTHSAFLNKYPDSFDIAFSHEAMYLLADLREHAKLIKSCLKDNGVYYAAIGCHTDNPLWPNWRKLISGHSSVPVQNYSLDDFANAFFKEGFSVSVRPFAMDGFVALKQYNEYFPTIKDSIDYHTQHKVLFRFQKISPSSSKTYNMKTTTEYAISIIKDSYHVLTNETDLSPNNPAVNDTLTRLVNVLSKEYSESDTSRILLDPEIQKLRRPMLDKLSLAESEMEFYWATKFCEKAIIFQKDMEDFWYWGNYNDLVASELKHVPNQIYKPNESICFVGSGPLPLTAIVLNQKTGKNVTCVDIDPIACAISKKFIKKAGYEKSINVVCTNGADYIYDRHPAILIASLVPNKNDIVRRIRESCENPCIGLRSAERLHTLLYDPVDETDEELGACTFSARTAYNPKILNTTLFYQGVLSTDFERGRTIKGHSRPKYGWRNWERPIITPEPKRG
jgi:SAM-dependent methyltransferase